jgi:catechol 2,3-dioxygenase-like lactoylglutathione lyase family enzyme
LARVRVLVAVTVVVSPGRRSKTTRQNIATEPRCPQQGRGARSGTSAASNGPVVAWRVPLLGRGRSGPRGLSRLGRCHIDNHNDVDGDRPVRSRWSSLAGGRSGPIQRAAPVASVVGVYHVRLPVSDVLRSRDWYESVLGFEPVLDYEEEDRLVGVALKHPSGVRLGLQLEPKRAPALRGFAVLSLRVSAMTDLEAWSAHFDRLGVEHSAIAAGHPGYGLEVADPDGICVELHTIGHSTTNDA